MEIYDIWATIFFFIDVIFLVHYIHIKKNAQKMWARVLECKDYVHVPRGGAGYWNTEVSVDDKSVIVSYGTETEPLDRIMIYKYKDKYFTDYNFYKMGSFIFWGFIAFLLVELFIYCYR